jgi:tail lysozyme
MAGPLQARRDFAVAQLMSRGWSPGTQAPGILGTITGENTQLDPTALDYKSRQQIQQGTAPTNPHVGLAQWDQQRLAGLGEFQQSPLAGWTGNPLEQQLNYIDAEMKGVSNVDPSYTGYSDPQAAAVGAMLAANPQLSRADVVRAMTKGYERPSPQEYASSIGGRIAAADQIAGPSSAPAPGGSIPAGQYGLQLADYQVTSPSTVNPSLSAQPVPSPMGFAGYPGTPSPMASQGVISPQMAAAIATLGMRPQVGASAGGGFSPGLSALAHFVQTQIAQPAGGTAPTMAPAGGASPVLSVGETATIQPVNSGLAAAQPVAAQAVPAAYSTGLAQAVPGQPMAAVPSPAPLAGTELPGLAASTAPISAAPAQPTLVGVVNPDGTMGQAWVDPVTGQPVAAPIGQPVPGQAVPATAAAPPSFMGAPPPSSMPQMPVNTPTPTGPFPTGEIPGASPMGSQVPVGDYMGGYFSQWGVPHMQLNAPPQPQIDPNAPTVTAQNAPSGGLTGLISKGLEKGKELAGTATQKVKDFVSDPANQMAVALAMGGPTGPGVHQGQDLPDNGPKDSQQALNDKGGKFAPDPNMPPWLARFIKGLPPDLQKVMMANWEDIVPEANIRPKKRKRQSQETLAA